MKKIPQQRHKIYCERFVLAVLAIAVCFTPAATPFALAQAINGPAAQGVVEQSGADREHVRIGVTSSRYDDIPSVLKSLKMPFSLTASSSRPLEDFRVLFVGCTTTEVFPPKGVRAFVEKGGVLYVSDLSYPILQAAFRELVPNWATDGPVGVASCAVRSVALQQTLGKQVQLHFNTPSWAYPMQPSNDIEPLITMRAPKGQIVIAFSAKVGAGKIIFTSFHNHANATALERSVISQVVRLPIAVAGPVRNVETGDASSPARASEGASPSQFLQKE